MLFFNKRPLNAKKVSNKRSGDKNNWSTILIIFCVVFAVRPAFSFLSQEQFALLIVSLSEVLSLESIAMFAPVSLYRRKVNVL